MTQKMERPAAGDTAHGAETKAGSFTPSQYITPASAATPSEGVRCGMSGNRLPVLMDEARAAHADAIHHTGAAAERSLAAGVG